MQPRKILVVDDEQNIRILLKDFLELEGYQVIESVNGREAIESVKALNGQLDLIILDIMLPFIDGYTVCREIKKLYSIPVIMLSARSEDFDEAHGFEIGADDYVTKPIKPTALMARINKLFHRLETSAGDSTVFEFDGLQINNASHIVTVDHDEIMLSPKEYDLLMLLIKNKGKVVSRETLMNEVWGFECFGGLRTIDTHINRLRTKLGTKSERIVTIRSYGYKFEG